MSAMKSGRMVKYFFCFFLTTYGALAQQDAKELLRYIEKSSSPERIRALESYEKNELTKNPSPENLQFLLYECHRIADRENDPEFKAFVEYYQRIVPSTASAEKNRETAHKEKIHLFEKTLAQYQSEGNDLYSAICLTTIGSDWFMLESYGHAIESMLLADEYFQKVNYTGTPMIGKYLHDMALVFYFFNEFEKVVALMEIAKQRPAYDQNISVQLFNNLGGSYRKLKQPKKSEQAFINAMALAKSENDSIWTVIASRNLANLYKEQRKYTEALSLYQETLLHVKNEAEQHGRNLREYGIHILGIAKIYIKMDEMHNAHHYMEKAETITIEIKNDGFFGLKQKDEQFRKIYYEVKQLYYTAMDDYEKAYRYSDSLNQIKRRTDSVYNNLQIHLASQRLHIQKNLSEIETAKQEKEILSARAWAISTGIALLTIIFILLFYIGKIRRKKEKEEYLYKERKMKKEQKRLNHELENLKIQMDRHLEKIKESNLLIKQYKTETTEDDAKIDLENLKILTKEHWEDFIEDFKKVHKRFYVKITKAYPYLTPSELRLVLLLKLGINQKELSGVLGTSDVNIRVTTHRLRQKIAKTPGRTVDREIHSFINEL